MTFVQIMETLLRSRLYRHQVRIKTEEGVEHLVLVRDVRYEGTRCHVVVTPSRRATGEFSIPLQRIVAVDPSDPKPPGCGRVA